MVLPSGLTEEISPDEDLVRFLFSDKHYNKVSIKAAAFVPHHDGTTSISRHGKEPLNRLWQIGTLASAGRTLYGAAFFRAECVGESCEDLHVEANEPPDFHAHIIGWDMDLEPSEPTRKARQIQQALLLASKCGAPFIKAENDIEESPVEVFVA